jgi:hypothetical protein
MKNRAADYAKLSVEFLRVVASLPKYLRLYFCLITDNRVSSKAKVLLVTAIGVLGAQFAFGGWAFRVQTWVTKKFGPIGFMPSLMIVLGTLDLCYKLIDTDVLEGYEKEIFGEGNTVQRDIALVVGFFGSRYDGLKAWWQKKADNVEVQMAGEGLIVNGEMTDEAIQDVADDIVELETSEALHVSIRENLTLLERDGGQLLLEAQRVLEDRSGV